MITALFRYRDSGIVDMVPFPGNVLGLMKDGKRPYRVEFKGTYEHEPVDKLKVWMYSKCNKALAAKDRESTVSIEGLPFMVNSTQ